ncbi:hypothetical protein ACJMK2_005368 [Sinanodonta woodiana]|uniref:Uncharacterized protein n=1 Tax=Sinanodonta woodiana TaxID=1069815 RepID=A0ABD3VSI3_SINWO
MADDQNLLQLPALGLPFELGTLYNVNKNQIVPAISLWEYGQENEIIHVRRNITHNTDVTTLDSLESQMNLLDIKGNFKINALANKLEVKGSGEVLRDNKTSKRKASVVLETKGTTKDEFISMSYFSKEKIEQHHDFIKTSGATHVVVGITYGYQFVLMLETTCKSENEKLKVQGKIELKLWSPIQGEAQGLYETEEEKNLNELKVRIFGTVQIPSNPISFQEAIEIYKKIPELVVDKECPIRVHLFPLASICSSLPKACSQINEAVLNSVAAMFEEISNSEVALNDIQTSDIAIKEPRIRKKAKKLSTQLKRHKIWLQMKLHDIMSDPKMEKEFLESKQIQKVLEKHENSPFSTYILDMYIAKIEKELRFIENLVAMLKFSQENDKSGSHQAKGSGENKIAIDILSDETDVCIPFEISKVYVLELPIIVVEDDVLKKMLMYDPDNDQGWLSSEVDSLTLPFEDTKMQKAILKCSKKFVHLTHLYPNEKFRCVLQGYLINKKPRIISYSATTGDIENVRDV